VREVAARVAREGGEFPCGRGEEGHQFQAVGRVQDEARFEAQSAAGVEQVAVLVHVAHQVLGYYAQHDHAGGVVRIELVAKQGLVRAVATDAEVVHARIEPGGKAVAPRLLIANFRAEGERLAV
jgi:hypothetical protein